MIAYPHFALPNLYLVNGYREIETSYGPAREYFNEDALEQCVRRILLRKPERLRGWDLRFLRNGLSISQVELGQTVDRDAQTVARWEKSSNPVPKFVDETIRVRFAAKFESGMGLAEVLSYVDGTAQKLPERILLSLTDTGWVFKFVTTVKCMSSSSRIDAQACIPSGHGFMAKIYVTEQNSGSVGILERDHKHGENSKFSILKVEQIITPNDGVKLSPEYKSSGTFYAQANSTVH